MYIFLYIFKCFCICGLWYIRMYLMCTYSSKLYIYIYMYIYIYIYIYINILILIYILVLLCLSTDKLAPLTYIYILIFRNSLVKYICTII